MKSYIILFVSILIFGFGVKSQVTTSPAPQWVKDIVDPGKDLKWYNWRDTFAIVSTQVVVDSLYDIAIEKVDMMIGHRKDILGQLKANNHILLLIGEGEETSDFQCYASFADTYGYGGTLAIPVSSIKTINFCWEDGCGVYREDILIHEFAHGIHLCGLNNTAFNSKLQSLYNSNKSKWINTYAYTNKEEYWAEITQSYFNCNYGGPSGGDGVHNNIDTRDELYAYDLSGYDLCVSIYGRIESDLPGKALSPNPVNESGNIDKNITLTWSAGNRSVTHDIFFGETNPPAKIKNQSSTSYTPGTLKDGTTYYWRIDEVNALGVKVGDVWAFTTKSITTNTELLENGIKIRLFPNPTYNTLFVECNSHDSISLTIFNLGGLKVYESKLKGTGVVNVSDYKAGIYIVRATKENKAIQTKIVIK